MRLTILLFCLMALSAYGDIPAGYAQSFTVLGVEVTYNVADSGSFPVWEDATFDYVFSMSADLQTAELDNYSAPGDAGGIQVWGWSSDGNGGWNPISAEPDGFGGWQFVPTLNYNSPTMIAGNNPPDGTTPATALTPSGGSGGPADVSLLSDAFDVIVQAIATALIALTIAFYWPVVMKAYRAARAALTGV